MNRPAWPLSFVVLSFAVVELASAGGCTSESTTLGPGAGNGRDASLSDAACANVGCSAPPACGEVCTAPCGCCPNTDCPRGDAAAEGGDASGADAGDAASE